MAVPMLPPLGCSDSRVGRTRWHSWSHGKRASYWGGKGKRTENSVCGLSLGSSSCEAQNFGNTVTLFSLLRMEHNLYHSRWTRNMSLYYIQWLLCTEGITLSQDLEWAWQPRAVQPWTGCLTPLGLFFSFLKWGKIIAPHSLNCDTPKSWLHIKHLVWCLGYYKRYINVAFIIIWYMTLGQPKRSQWGGWRPCLLFSCLTGK